MKIVGVDTDNLDNNLDMVTRGQQQQPRRRRMLQILYIGGIRTLGRSRYVFCVNFHL